MAGDRELYWVGECRLDVGRRELSVGGEPVGVEPKAFDLLVYLTRHRDRTVSKDELFEALWPRMVVSDAALTSCVKKARKAIGDDSATQTVIRTVQRRGYRLVAEVQEGHPQPTEQPLAAAPATVPPAEQPSLIVLPFTFTGQDERIELLADGLTEEIITDLSRNGWLFVIGRATSFAYKGQNIATRTIADDIGVRYVVSGSIRLLGDRLRVAAELVEAASGAQEWAERYDRPLTDLFEVQDEIAAGIVSSLGSQLRRAEGRRARRADPTSLDAWGLVNRGMAVSWATFNPGSHREAETLYRRALELDPDNGRAHAFLGCGLAMKVTNGWSQRFRQDRQEAWAEIRKAMDIAPDDPIVLGQVAHAHTCLGDAETANRLFERSIRLDPNNAFSIGVRAYALAILGRAPEAIAAVDDVMRRSPKDPATHWYLAFRAWALLQLGQFADCLEAVQSSIDHYSGWQPPVITLGVVLAALGEGERGREAVKRGRRLAPHVPRVGYEDFFRLMVANDDLGDRLRDLLRELWPDDEDQ